MRISVLCSARHAVKRYTTSEVARLAGLPPERIRRLVRCGVLVPRRSRTGRYLYSFQDIVLLRTAQTLRRGNAVERRLWKVLGALAQTLPSDRALASVRMGVAGKKLTVRERNESWEADSGQAVFEFAPPPAGGEVHGFARRCARRPRPPRSRRN